MKRPGSTMRMAVRAGALGFIYIFAILWPQHYSEESILKSPISDPVFGGLWETKRHVVEDYFTKEHFTSMKQSVRLGLLVEALNVTISALNLSNIPAFLDAGVLLGWYRHQEKMIPWDIDADVGIDGNDCLKKYPNQSTLEARVRSFLPHPYVLEYLDCKTDPARGRGFAGIVTDTRNGLKVDIFGFHAVDGSGDSFSWRRNGSWIQRDLDRDMYHKVFPRDSIYPLQEGNFSGITGRIIPNDPKRALQWDFGFVLDPPIFPLGMSLKISIHPVALLAVGLFILAFGNVADIIITLLAIMLLGGGFRVITLLLTVLGAGENGPSSAKSHKRAMLRFLCLFLLLNDFQPLGPQAFAAVMEAIGFNDFIVNQQRYCFLYKVLCVDT